MYIKVKGSLFSKDLIIDGDKLIHGDDTYNVADVSFLNLSKPIKMLQFACLDSNGKGSGIKDVRFSGSQLDNAEQAYEYLKSNSRAMNVEEIGKQEHRKRCNVCGRVWCYNNKDLGDNSVNKLLAGTAAVGGIASALGGTIQQQHLSYDMMQRTQKDIVDYDRCPDCHSYDTSDITEAEYSAASQKIEPTKDFSAADEILKYNELLEKGIITQEEFDAKKKQLLGL